MGCFPNATYNLRMRVWHAPGLSWGGVNMGQTSEGRLATMLASLPAEAGPAWAPHERRCAGGYGGQHCETRLLPK
eukprot:9498393-Pyramimonas_sp.AAC.1